MQKERKRKGERGVSQHTHRAPSNIYREGVCMLGREYAAEETSKRCLTTHMEHPTIKYSMYSSMSVLR